MAAYQPGRQPLLIVYGGLTFTDAATQETEGGTISNELFVYGVYDERWLTLEPIGGQRPPGLFFSQQLDYGVCRPLHNNAAPSWHVAVCSRAGATQQCDQPTCPLLPCFD